ncbi:hypothetical protein ACIOV9_21085 [Pseudomonas iridis]|uniref:hypothetical protein n=1 Tax=Pseudomonas iridis TaxID=2710587 RepID=UPI0037F47BCA
MKVVATNGYKKATTTCTPNPVGAAEGCNLLTRMFLNPKQDQKITACGSAYTKRYKNDHKKKRPEPVGAFSRGCGLGFTAV